MLALPMRMLQLHVHHLRLLVVSHLLSDLLLALGVLLGEEAPPVLLAAGHRRRGRPHLVRVRVRVGGLGLEGKVRVRVRVGARVRGLGLEGRVRICGRTSICDGCLEAGSDATREAGRAWLGEGVGLDLGLGRGLA